MDRREAIESLYLSTVHIGLTEPLSDAFVASLASLGERARDPARAGAVARIDPPQGNTSTRSAAVAWLAAAGVRDIPADGFDPLLSGAATAIRLQALAAVAHQAGRQPGLGSLPGLAFADPSGLTVKDCTEFLLAKGIDVPRDAAGPTVPQELLFSIVRKWGGELLARRGRASRPPAAGRQRNFSDPADPYGLRALAERTRARYEDEERRQGRQATAPAELPAYRFADNSAAGLEALRKRLIAKYEQDEQRRKAKG